MKLGLLRFGTKRKRLQRFRSFINCYQQESKPKPLWLTPKGLFMIFFGLGIVLTVIVSIAR